MGWVTAALYAATRAGSQNASKRCRSGNEGPYLDSDAVFGVTQELGAEFAKLPEGHRVLNYDFALKALA